MSGKIHLILGPMFSGKSTTLLTRYRRYRIAGKNCLLIKYAGDNRYFANEEQLVTHDLISYKAVSCRRLADMSETVRNYDVVCIDEVQFYPDAAETCDAWANSGIIVEACGLNGDFKRRPFEQISRLIPLCESINHICAVCKVTGEDAPFSKRLSNEEEQEVVGGADKYTSVSRAVYFQP